VFGVEPVCRMLTEHGLKIAPSTYYAARSRPASARAVRDEQLKARITRVWRDNFEVYGADKTWRELNRQGVTVARCTVARPMRELGIQGVRRGRTVPASVDTRLSCPIPREHEKWVRHAARIRRIQGAFGSFRH
jgi:putative transposase